jgi:hypothetical protein
VLTRWRVQGDGITTMLDSEEETGTGMVKAVLKVFIPDECTGQSVSVSNFVAPSLSAACPSQPNLIAKIIAISTVPEQSQIVNEGVCNYRATCAAAQAGAGY